MPCTATKVMRLSVADLREIQSMRITLERFAFEEAWPRRGVSFAAEIKRRHAVLTHSIDAGDKAHCITAELALHGLVYEASGMTVMPVRRVCRQGGVSAPSFRTRPQVCLRRTAAHGTASPADITALNRLRTWLSGMLPRPPNFVASRSTMRFVVNEPLPKLTWL